MSKLIQKFMEWWIRDEFAERMAEVRERMDEEERLEKLDDFAKHIIAAMIQSAPNGTGFGVDHPDTNETYAIAAYSVAKAMFKERAK